MIRPRHQAIIGGLFVLLLAGLTAGFHIAKAQSSLYQVGLIIQFKDGATIRQCVEINSPETTGYDVLMRSGLGVISDFNSWLGAGVCKIENDGCSADECFCDMPNYWSYWHLGLDAQGQPGWQYSSLGASNYLVHTGDVEGWHYGEAAPPGEKTSFEEICAASTATATTGVFIPPETSTSPPPTARSIPPTTPPQWATAIIIGPTYTAVLPTRTLETVPIKTSMLPSPSTLPSTTPLTALESPLQPVVEVQPASTTLPTQTRTALEPSETPPASEGQATPEALPTATESKLAARLEFITTPGSQPVQALPVSPESGESTRTSGFTDWVLILGGLAGFGSFMGFFLVLLGSLTAIYFLRRR